MGAGDNRVLIVDRGTNVCESAISLLVLDACGSHYSLPISIVRMTHKEK
jgi:hypothetical protein